VKGLLARMAERNIVVSVVSRSSVFVFPSRRAWLSRLVIEVNNGLLLRVILS
jgi:hypothetical protein